MSNVFDEMRAAMLEAEARMRSADVCAQQMAEMLIGRLSRCEYSTLCRLKRELRDFDMHTGDWK